MRQNTLLLVAVLSITARGAEPPASQYSPLSQIDSENVMRLQTAWTYRTGERAP